MAKKFRLPGAEVRISRVGDKIILEPMTLSTPGDPAAFWAEIDAVGDQPFMAEGRQQPLVTDERCVFEE